MTLHSLHELPPPSSGLFLEIAFRRLLASCEEIAAGTSATARQEAFGRWQTSPAFHHYVETLQEQLADLEDNVKLDPQLLQVYQDRVKTLSTSLQRPELPELCRLVGSLQQGQAHGHPHVAASAVQAPPNSHVVRPAPAVTSIPAAPLSHRPLAGSASPSREASSPPRPLVLSDAAASALQQHGRVQETLTDELADMASALKSNTLTMETKVKERGELLEGTETALDKSLAHTRASAGTADAVRRRGRVNFCLSCLVMLIIAVGFAAMYLFIRVTSLTGYKASKARGVAPARPHGVKGGHEEL